MKPNPNICPYCDAPLTDLGQCVSPNCETNRECDLCPGIRLTVRGRCPNTACPNSFMGDSVEPPPRTRDATVFTRATMQFDVPMIACRICGKRYESVFLRCPHCEERVAELRETFSAFNEEGNNRLTIPCPDPSAFDLPSAHAAETTLPKDPKPPFVRKSSRPDLQFSIEDADETEAEILAQETQKLLQGEDDPL